MCPRRYEIPNCMSGEVDRVGMLWKRGMDGFFDLIVSRMAVKLL